MEFVKNIGIVKGEMMMGMWVLVVLMRVGIGEGYSRVVVWDMRLCVG